jgi:hypothetical protein
MRPILLLVGLSMLSVAFTAGYLQTKPDAPEFAALPLAAAPPSGPANSVVGQSIDAQDTAAPPLIVLAPKGNAKGARFVKPPLAD